jgi:hypothetical protein
MTNEDTVFAGTLRDWCDPLLKGQAPRTVLRCPRCALCKCHAVKELPGTSRRSHCHHHSACLNYTHHPRSKTVKTQRLMIKTKRRANSYDPLLSVTKFDIENSSFSSLNGNRQRTMSASKIPVRILSTLPSSMMTLASEYSSTSSIHDKHSTNTKTRIPRPIQNSQLLSAKIIHGSRNAKSNTDDDIEEYDVDR